MKTFLGFTTGLLTGVISGIIITSILMVEDSTYYNAVESVWNGQKPERSDYAVDVEDLND